ncbi:HAD-IIIC family phosphatase [Harryflintia acetispora]|uniref:HAD-IIIC family phosphatase n=1 Tax=Harryflintia acetispora TaxID=1849041 RepID=UPI00189933EA|nr:HAD-IIIC family phosphatase [Harryflintia acetispora]
MHPFLEYPFDAQLVLKKRKSIKKELLVDLKDPLQKKIAILGGSTTHDIKDILELFLLNQGIFPTFYESEYNQFWQDAMFDSPELLAFSPDIILIHTSLRNLSVSPDLEDDVTTVNEKLESEFQRFCGMWDHLQHIYRCPIIQNNFEYPFYRLMGNMEASDFHGKVNFVTRLNLKFYEYAQDHPNFHIHDLNYLSADYGLEEWSDPFYWHMYKYALCLPAVPRLAFSYSNMIKSIYGRNKKAFALDLDNTLWGGIIGDDGVDNIEIGSETSLGQVYTEFQFYLKEHKKLGILLNIISKNESENAMAGLNHPDCPLKPSDFIVIKANWLPKSRNLSDMAEDLTLLPESFVFVDDNPAERANIQQQFPEVAIPEIKKVEHYINLIDRCGYFEVTNLSEDDKNRNDMYKKNAERKIQQKSFENYQDYLISLNMKAIIKEFDSIHMSRIAQLTNKSNQFNLTTRRYTQEEVEAAALDENTIALYGKLEDKFGDNGVVTIVIGECRDDTLHLVLWLMSCRVLKRDMEFAMMDEIVRLCKIRGIQKIKGYYYPTAKNSMVKDFYALQGFTKEAEDPQGNSTWNFPITDDYQQKNQVIEIAQQEAGGNPNE